MHWQVLEPCVLLHAPLDAGEGILWVETELAGVLSEPRALVLTANADIAEEIQSLPESGSNQGMSEEDMDSLIVDIGMVLQYASQAQPARGHKPRKTLIPSALSGVAAEYSNEACILRAFKPVMAPRAFRHLCASEL